MVPNQQPDPGDHEESEAFKRLDNPVPDYSPEARRKAIPGVRLCVACQTEHDKESAAFAGYNRRGSKDSQLR